MKIECEIQLSSNRKITSQFVREKKKKKTKNSEESLRTLSGFYLSFNLIFSRKLMELIQRLASKVKGTMSFTGAPLFFTLVKVAELNKPQCTS